MSNELHILSMRGSGYLNLKVVDITLNHRWVKIGGDNRAGKSGLFSLIELMGGKKYLPELPLRKGEKKGKFEIQLADEDRTVKYIVKFSFTPKSSYITMEDAEGKAEGLEMLKTFLSPCLNPWSFFADATAEGVGAKERRARAVEVIKELMTFDFDAEAFIEELGFMEDMHVKSLLSQSSDPLAFLKAFELYLMENRKKWKEKGAKLTGSIKLLKEEIPPEQRDAKEVDVQKLFDKQERIQKSLVERDGGLREAQTIEGSIAVLKDRLRTEEERLEALRQKNSGLINAQELNDELVKLKEEIDSISDRNLLARKAVNLREQEKEVEQVDEVVEGRDAKIETIREERITVLEAADMPVDGITIEDGNIFKHGIPLGQDSEEEGLTDSFMIGLAKFEKMSPEVPKLKTMLVPNASLLGKKAMAHLYKLAEEHGIQVILELVMDKAEKGVIFVEDGVATTEAGLDV